MKHHKNYALACLENIRSHLSAKAQLCLDPHVTSIRKTNILVSFDNIINLIKEDISRGDGKKTSEPEYTVETIDAVTKFLKDLTPNIENDNARILYPLFFTERLAVNSNENIASNRGNMHLIKAFEEIIKSEEEKQLRDISPVKTAKTNTNNTQTHNVKEKSRRAWC